MLKHPILRLLISASVCWTGFILWVTGIFWASSQPSGPQPPLFFIPHFDKFLHATAFCIGALLLCFALKAKPGFPVRTTQIITLIVLSLYGVLDEIHQLSTPGRSGGDLGDMTADVVGTFLGVLLFKRLYEQFR